VKKLPLALAAVALAAAMAASASPADAASQSKNRSGHGVVALSSDVSFDGTWYRFEFGSQGSTSNETYSFTIKTPTRMTVVDIGCRGDVFDVYNGDKKLLSTPFVPLAGGCVGSVEGAEAAIADGGFSYASKVLKPGTYTISIVASESPYGVGAGDISFSSPGKPIHMR